MCLINLFALQGIFSIDGFSQSCNNGIQDGDEFRQDCGGSLCVDCIPLLYKVECEDELGGTGVFDISVNLPPYLWTDETLVEHYFELAGDLNIECYTLNECQGFSNYQEGNLAQVFIYKKSLPDMELQGYGSITGELYCVKSDLTAIYCPDSLDFNLSATYEKIPLDDSDSHMLKIEISGGSPPYSIRDNNTDDFFYKIGIPESTYYLGAIPDGVELDIDIIDINGCVAPIFSFDGSDCTAGYSISIGNTALDCKGDNLGNGSIILKDQGSCNHTLELDGQQGDTLRGLSPGSYTFNVLNLSNNTTKEETRTITVGLDYTPLKLSFTSFPPGVCGDATLGNINILMEGGVPSYRYKWDDCIDCGSSRSDLDFGTYTVEVSDEYGCRTTQTIELKASENAGTTFNVYPTFHDLEAKLQFCLDSESRVTISAYAANGQYLGTIVNDEVLNGGGHLYSSFTTGFPSGVYFYALEIEGEDTRVVKTVKM